MGRGPRGAGEGGGTLHAVISHHVVPGYKSSIDLLTRFGEGSDFASDVCIRKDGSDAEGCRYLEEVAFEVVSTQTRRHMTIRAEDMTRRGVRRVIAIFVGTQTVEEWQVAEQRWQVLDRDSHLSDPTFVRPILVRALLDAALALDEVVKAAEAKGSQATRAIREAGKREGRREGKREGAREGELAGKREALARLLVRRFGPLPEATQQRLAGASMSQLDRWLDRILDATALDDALA